MRRPPNCRSLCEGRAKVCPGSIRRITMARRSLLPSDTRMVAKYGFFVLEVVRAWLDRAVICPQTIHHLGHGNFMVAGERIKLKSRMK